MDQVLPYIFNALGGAALAPAICAATGGKGLGGIGKVIAGMVGGVVLGAVVEAAGLENLFGPDNTIVSYAQDLVEGAIGGGVLATLIAIMKGKTHA